MTNKIVLKTVEETMNDFVPVYPSFMSLFLAGAQFYEETVGSVKLNRVEAVGDIRMRRITPKDTEIKQISVGPSQKIFNKYYDAIQYVISYLQGYEEAEVQSINNQVLDENFKLNDERFLYGDGTAANNVMNNALYWSADPNYVLKTSIEIKKGTDADYLSDLIAQMGATITELNNVAGRKMIAVYGTKANAKLSGLFKASNSPFRKIFEEAYPGVELVSIPSSVQPAGDTSGWIGINMDQIQVRATTLPKLSGQGDNDEKMYTWHNYMTGSSMVDVKSLGGIIRQPVTFEV